MFAQALYLDHHIQHPNLDPDCPQCLEQAALDSGMAVAAADVASVPFVGFTPPRLVVLAGRSWHGYRSRAPPGVAVPF